MPDAILTPPRGHTAPNAFTRAQLDWLPWLEHADPTCVTWTWSRASRPARP
jgi:hypothetical protein